MTCFRSLLLAVACALLPWPPRTRRPRQSRSRRRPPMTQIGSGRARRCAAARFQPRGAADDAADAAAQAGVPRHAPVHAAARRRETSAIWRRTSSASTRARRSASSCGTASRRGTQIGVHRTSDRTIQIFGQHNFLNERDGKPLGLDAIATLEGANNLHDALPERARRRRVAQRRPPRGALRRADVRRRTRNPFANAGVRQQHADGGTRRAAARPARRPTSSAEITPRLGGFDPGVSQ